MPREFYGDTYQGPKPIEPGDEFCLAETTLFDGPAICTREPGHKVDDMKSSASGATGEFHQEQYEGWVWDNNGRVG